MRIEETDIGDVKIVHLEPHGDDRGLFVETFDARALAALGIDAAFVQDAVSVSSAEGTVRGLHFQAPPRAQAKLVRVARGRALEVAVDLRDGSPTFGRHVALAMDGSDWRQLFIPAGFAHGFCTLEPDTEIVYKLSDHYAPDQAMGVLWNDPDLGIDWPVTADRAVISEKDQNLPRLRNLPGVFGASP